MVVVCGSSSSFGLQGGHLTVSKVNNEIKNVLQLQRS